MRGSAQRAARRPVDLVLDWFDARDAIQLTLLVFLAASIMIVLLVTEDAPTDPRSEVLSPVEQPPPLVGYTNRDGGYGFDYPSSWDANSAGTLTRLESPTGRIIVTFDVAAPGTLRAVSHRLVGSLHANAKAHGLIGTRRERIAGAPSLLASGIGEDATGRSIRFVAIVVGGRSDNYEISIVVPAGSDPSRLLPPLEHIVSSFDILDASTFSTAP
jgi:hypothetical protein